MENPEKREKVRGASDHELLISILDRVSALEQLTATQLHVQGELLHKHDRALTGVDGSNGLLTRVSKLESRWKFLGAIVLVSFSGFGTAIATGIF